MYLKALEIQGFKSFPDKTVLTFDGAITAIVGPNGSGKSNLSDALRWVMGEQSTRTLRGGKMEDVIFGGTQRRNQVGFAEVSLILDNTARIFPMEESEVMVTRRYYRSGESEYYINRRGVRLRDVTDLFMDTGLGRDGYSVIGQGRIDEILSVRSADRREIFEEAAGISRFRHRKEEAERKLCRTDENLRRIADKLDELELQVGPLREQSERAKRYLILRDELREIEVSLWLDGLDKLRSASRKALDDYEAASQQREEARAAVDRLYAETEAGTERMREQDRLAEAVRGRISAAEAELGRGDAEAAVLKANIQNNLEQIERLTREMEEDTGRAGGLDAQIQERRSRLEEITAERAETAAGLDQQTKEAERAAAASGDLAAALAVLRVKEETERARAAEEREALSGLTSSAQELLDRDSALRADLAVRKERLGEARASAAEMEQSLRSARENAEAVRNVVTGHEKRLETRLRRADEARERDVKLHMEENALQSRIAMLEEMEKVYEGYSKSVRVVMSEAAGGALRGVRGPVANLIRVPDEYAVAVEVALGGALQHIVTEREEDAKAAIGCLKRKDGGRATFLPMNAIEARALRERGMEREPGYVGIAAELVEFDAQYAKVIGSLLGRTVIVEQLDAGIAMARKYAHRLRIVTLDGQLLNPGGSMTGGSVSQNTGILSRANELGRLREQLRAMRGDRAEAQAAAETAKRELEAAQYALSVAREEQRGHEDDVLRLEGEAARARQLSEELERDAAALEEELGRVHARGGQLDEEIAHAREEIARRTAAAEELREEIVRREAGQTELNAAADAVVTRISELRARLAALDAERAATETALGELTALRQAFSGDRARRETHIADLRGKNEEWESALLLQGKELARIRAAAEEEHARLCAISEEKLKLEGARTQSEREAQERNRELMNLEAECARLEQKKATAALEEKQIIDRLWDNYELSYSAAQAVRRELENTAKAGRRAAELRRDISALGTPNLGAIEEFERVNSRYEFLTGQRDDVMTARAELESIIRDLSEEMKVIFAREFRSINESFGAVFTELFGGGRASLELENEDDILNCGIEIKVQPPGKALKVLSLLSGGEKAFVAIALYFAILKVRPTPFCIMDEIEAALDEVNVVRFARYLRAMSEKTQFLAITHRRGTMEEADVLYGVTMQEQGISKILTINLNDMERALKIG